MRGGFDTGTTLNRSSLGVLLVMGGGGGGYGTGLDEDTKLNRSR